MKKLTPQHLQGSFGTWQFIISLKNTLDNQQLP